MSFERRHSYNWSVEKWGVYWWHCCLTYYTERFFVVNYVSNMSLRYFIIIITFGLRCVAKDMMLVMSKRSFKSWPNTNKRKGKYFWRKRCQRTTATPNKRKRRYFWRKRCQRTTATPNKRKRRYFWRKLCSETTATLVSEGCGILLLQIFLFKLFEIEPWIIFVIKHQEKNFPNFPLIFSNGKVLPKNLSYVCKHTKMYKIYNTWLNTSKRKREYFGNATTAVPTTAVLQQQYHNSSANHSANTVPTQYQQQQC